MFLQLDVLLQKFLKMDKNQNAQESYAKKFLIMFFSKVILVNEHQEYSTVFVISTQILKLLFSNILVFCVFVVKNMQEDQQGYLIWCLKQLFKNKSWQNYQIFKLINFSTLGLQLIFIALLFVNQKNQKKFQVLKIVYFMNIFMRFTSQLFFCILGIVFYISLRQAQYHIAGATLFDIIAWIFLFKITPIFQQMCIFQTKDAFCHNHNSSAQIVSIFHCILTFVTPALVFFQFSQIIEAILSIIWILRQDTFKEQNSLKIKFSYIKVLLGKQTFYKLQVKELDEIQSITNKGQMMTNANNSDIIQDCNIKNKYFIDDLQNGQLGQQQNSSMASFGSQLGYGISKLISHFTQILLNPRKLQDQRTKKKLFIDIFFYFICLGILISTMIINKCSLDQKIRSLKAKNDIDQVFHLVQVSSAHVFNLYAYRSDQKTSKIIIEEMIWDYNHFLAKLDTHFLQINIAKTSLQGEELYDYLRYPVVWTFADQSVKQFQLLEFFEMVFYLILQIRDGFLEKKQFDRYSLNLLTLNVNRLRKIRQQMVVINNLTMEKNQIFTTYFLVFSIFSLAGFSTFYGLYLNDYRKFRFNQSQNHISLYKIIPDEIIKNLTQYYTVYYKFYVLGKVRIYEAIQNQKQIIEIQLQQPSQNQQPTPNKIRLVGKNVYLFWIVILAGFLVINGANTIISFNMFKFNNQVNFFYNLAYSISYSESLLVNRLLRTKAQYYFLKSNFTQAYLLEMLTRVNQTQVAFTSYATFEPNQITKNNVNFRSQFNKLLTTNPCALHSQKFTPRQLEICNQQSILSKNGIITFVNGFVRLLKNSYLNWRKNLNTVLNQTDFIASRTQFRQYDLMVTFHIPTFQLLVDKIISVYHDGFDLEYETYFLIFIFIIVVLTIILVENIRKFHRDRSNLSYLYGYLLLLPSCTFKKSKHLLKFIQDNLQFSSKI